MRRLLGEERYGWRRKQKDFSFSRDYWKYNGLPQSSLPIRKRNRKYSEKYCLDEETINEHQMPKSENLKCEQHATLQPFLPQTGQTMQEFQPNSLMVKITPGVIRHTSSPQSTLAFYANPCNTLQLSKVSSKDK